MPVFDCKETAPRDLYALLSRCVVPRPIAWVSSLSGAGVLNLAPFSFFNLFSVNPPVLGIGIGSRRIADPSGRVTLVPKDTCINILESGEFVVNIVSMPLVNQMNQSSGEYAATVSEFEKVGLAAAPSVLVQVARVADALVSFECNLLQKIDLGNSSLILGSIVYVHVDDSIYCDGAIDIARLQPVGRVGSDGYCAVQQVFNLPRPVVEE